MTGMYGHFSVSRWPANGSLDGNRNTYRPRTLCFRDDDHAGAEQPDAHHIRPCLWHVAVQLMSVGAGLGAVFALEPRIQIFLKIIGTAYLLWLAYKLWRAAEMPDASLAKPVSFFQAAAFQFVNPKAWLIAVTVIAAFISPDNGYLIQLVFASAIFTVVGIPCLAVWASFGAGLRQVLHDPSKLLLINRSMSALAALTAGLFWL